MPIPAALETENGSHHDSKSSYGNQLACPVGLGSWLDWTTATGVWNVGAGELINQVETRHLFFSFKRLRLIFGPVADEERLEE